MYYIPKILTETQLHLTVKRNILCPLFTLDLANNKTLQFLGNKEGFF